MLDTQRRQNAHTILTATVESPLQEEARKLYDAGLNVFPQPIGHKAGYPWKKLQYVRLHRTHFQFGLHALFAGKCNIAVMCGRTSDHLFVIDCETRLQFDYNIQQMRQREIPLWAVETSRGGHVYLRSTAGEVESIAPGRIVDTELRGKGYVIAPPSIHPNGTIYQWLHREGDSPPAINPAKIDWLKTYDGSNVEAKCGGHDTERKTNKKIYNPLCLQTQDYIANGGFLAEGSRNNRLFNAACDMNGTGHTRQDAHTTLAPVAKNSGLGSVEITHTIHSAFSKERTPAKRHSHEIGKESSFHTISKDWQIAKTYTENRTWPGRTGNTDRAVMLALAERARLGSNENATFRASVREIAVLARISRDTAHKALKRLKADKLIIRAGQDITSHAGLWHFGDSVLRNKQRETSPANWYTRKNGLSSSVLVSRSDAVERGALGRSGMRAYRALIAHGPLLPKKITMVSGLSVGQVEHGLRKLRQYDLVERLPEGWNAIPATDAQLDERVAWLAGTLGKGEARSQRYRDERALFAGREIYEARLRKDAHFLFYGRFEMGAVMPNVLDESEKLNHEEQSSDEAMPVWKCPNCGQHHFGDDPPDMCAYCTDFTTWKRVEEQVKVEHKKRDSSD